MIQTNRVARRLNAVLINIPQIEADSISNHQKIREFLFESKEPLKASEIAKRLKMNPNTVRRNCRELHMKGFISQPGRTGRTELLIADLNITGKTIVSSLTKSVTAYACTSKDMDRYVEYLLSSGD